MNGFLVMIVAAVGTTIWWNNDTYLDGVENILHQLDNQYEELKAESRAGYRDGMNAIPAEHFGTRHLTMQLFALGAVEEDVLKYLDELDDFQAELEALQPDEGWDENQRTYFLAKKTYVLELMQTNEDLLNKELEKLHEAQAQVKSGISMGKSEYLKLQDRIYSLQSEGQKSAANIDMFHETLLYRFYKSFY